MKRKAKNLRKTIHDSKGQVTESRLTNNMTQHHLTPLAILNTLSVILNSVVCSTASSTSPLLFLDYGEMEDFMKLIQRYRTSSQLLFPSKEDDQGRMDEVIKNMELTVSLAVIYIYNRNKWYKK